MFGDVVLRHREAPRNLVDVERLVEQQSDDADPGVFSESSEGDDAAVPVNDGKCAATGWKTVELNGLINLAGSGHGGRNTSSHKPLPEASRDRTGSALRGESR